MLPKFNKNQERERQKGGERKKSNFGNTVIEISLPKFLPVLKKSNCGNTIAEIGKKRNFFFGNYGNGIAENEKKKN